MEISQTAECEFGGLGEKSELNMQTISKAIGVKLTKKVRISKDWKAKQCGSRGVQNVYQTA